jgi:predicted nucleotidyltransferase
VLCERRGLYCLAGREELLVGSTDAEQRALDLRRRALRVARFLRHMPFVRGLLLTGSAAAGAAGSDADVDLLVIVADGRISLVFALLGPLSRLTSRRLFCPNHYLSDAHLELRSRRDLYVARELVQARALAGCAAELAAANGWVQELLPNAGAGPAPATPLSGGQRLQRLLELPFRGRSGDRLERRLRGLAASRLAAHHGLWDRAVPLEALEQLEAGAELRFHGKPGTQSVLQRYQARRAELTELLRAQST